MSTVDRNGTSWPDKGDKVVINGETHRITKVHTPPSWSSAWPTYDIRSESTGKKANNLTSLELDWSPQEPFRRVDD